jgi:arylsulfatase A-like enzyme
MATMIEKVARSQTRQIVATALCLALFWIGIEFAHAVVADLEFGMSFAVKRVVRYLPWHLALFLAAAIPVAIGARFSEAISRRSDWWVLGLATIAYSAPIVALGAHRAFHSVAFAILAGVAVLVGTLAVIGSLVFSARWVPDRLRAGWFAIASVGWGLIFVPAMRRAAAPVSLGAFEFSDMTRLVQPVDLAIFVTVTGLFAFGWMRSRTLGSGLLVVLTLSPTSVRSVESQTENGFPDVVVVLIDTLRADHLGASVDGGSLTPNLDAFASESVRFSQAYSGGNRTFQSLPAIMTSLSADVVGRSLSGEAETLAERLHAAGFSTVGLSANPLVSHFYGYDQGFDVLYDPASQPDYLVTHWLRILGSLFPSIGYQWGLVAADLYYPRVDELRERGMRLHARVARPAFLYVQTMDVHGPYLPPKEFLPADYRSEDFFSYFDFLSLAGREEITAPSFAAKIENLRQRYAAELRFTDAELGKLFEHLKRIDRWDDTLVWVLADHGESFGEHGHAGHSGRNFTSTVLHVPMLMKPPKSAQIAPSVVSQTVSTYDVLPTTLSLVGIPVPEGLFGESLVGPNGRLRVDGRGPAIADDTFRKERERLFSVIDGRWKLDCVFSIDDDGRAKRRSLYDLETDPAENEDVASRHTEVADRLERIARRRIHRERGYELERTEMSVDPSVRERLRNLGYIEDE